MSLDVYLDVCCHSGAIGLSVSSAIALFVGAFCEVSRDRFYLVNCIPLSCSQQTVSICRDVLGHIAIVEPEEIPYNVRQCALPAAVSGRVIHSGMCSVLRRIVKSENRFIHILGQRQNCLKACAEVSPWTKFCEVQMPSAVEKFLVGAKLARDSDKSLDIESFPDELFQLEGHLSTPPVVSNANKRIQEIKKRGGRNQPHSSHENEDFQPKCNSMVLRHVFMEGLDFLLTDLILTVCLTLILNEWKTDFDPVQSNFKEVFEWYNKVLLLSSVKESLMATGLPILDIRPKGQTTYKTICEKWQKNNLLFIRDPEIKKVKCCQKEIDEVLWKFQAASIETKMQPHPVSYVCLEWDGFPSNVHPRDGDLPLKRLEKKCQQIESMVAAVKLLARPKDTIVDFCSGGGHLGLLLAFLMPDCQVILVENKEESLLRAIARIEALELTNIVAFQTNLDYFNMPFNIGVCLHGCGVATDLVLKKCLDHSASFVICPCCYGSIRDTHLINYPRSDKYQHSGISYRDYLIVAHSSDQTQADIAQAKQGKLSMEYVDTDRLTHAEEFGYQTVLCTLSPPSCSPKNNLLIGFAPQKS